MYTRIEKSDFVVTIKLFGPPGQVITNGKRCIGQKGSCFHITSALLENRAKETDRNGGRRI